ncbi:MAG: CapA family protein [Clostridia bacterium]|nr:CapA family protein [Clostridia bacterium]
MQGKSNRQKAIIRRRIFIAALAVFLAAVIALLSCVWSFIIPGAKNLIDDLFKQSSITDVVDSSDEQTGDTGEIESEKEKEPVTATVINTGDILIHSTVLDGAKTSDGNYDFSAFFTEAESYFKAADIATANLEITLGGTESGAFSGYPAFNSPDSILDVLKNSGINFVTTANNHCYDTGFFGLKRTVQQLKLKGIGFNGTKEVETDPTYVVKDVNGIKIGMVSFTYENQAEQGRKSINGNIVKVEANNLINSFSYDRLDSFYQQAQSVIDNMQNDGADAVVFYMHWGEEYQLSANTWQKTIAQKLCNMGVDVIVGGHPHVVQPMELLHSEDSQNTTVCIYSIGNAISNQRQEIMNPECVTGHTEDGVLFEFTFTKYHDGETSLTAVDVIPTWVNKYRGGSGYQYTMYPLENADMANNYGLDATAVSKAKASYERTKKQIAAGLTECQKHLGCKVRFADEQVSE